MAKKPNIILITVDSLRAKHLGFMGYRRNISPNLDSLAKESAVFTQAFATGPNSSHSFPSILTSTYPLDYQPLHIDKNRVLLSEVLRGAGYRTCCFQTSPFLSEFFGYNRGWDYFEDVSIHIPKDKFFNPHSFQGMLRTLFIRLSTNTSAHLFFVLLYLRNKIKSYFEKPRAYKTEAPLINKLIQEFITANKDAKKPFFVWAHYQDVHGPFIPYDCRLKPRQLSYSELIGRNLPTLIANYPSENKAFKEFSKKHIEKTIEFYDDGIKYFDEQFAGLLEFLKEENLDRETILCITSDHGDEFLEHGGVGHYEQKLYNEVLHIPLLIKAPGLENQRIEKKVSLIDLAPNLCQLAGVEKPASYKGKSLFEEKDDLVFHQISFSDKKDFWQTLEPGRLKNCIVASQTGDWKYIRDFTSQKEELYYLKEDGKEENNLIGIRPQVAAQMNSLIERFKKENPPFTSI